MSEPVPSEHKAAIAGLFDRAAPTYDQVGVDFFGTVADGLVERTSPGPGERVLDLGCGRGASAIRAARAVGPDGRVLATDLAPRMVEGVRSKAVDLPWLSAELGDAEHPPAGPWDVIQASLVMFFLPHVDAALVRCRDVLTAQGRLGLTWFGDVDGSWEPVYGTIVSGLPPEDRPPRDVTRSGPFESIDTLEASVRDGGFGAVSTTARRVEVRFADAAQWWAWSWSQGHRALLEGHERNGTLADLRERIDPLLHDRAREGRLSWWTDVRCTLAER